MTQNQTAYENGNRVAVADFNYAEVEGDRGNPLTSILNEDDSQPWEFLLNEPRALQLLSKFSRVMAKVVAAPNSKMSGECFMIATGDTGDEAVIERRIVGTAKRHGVTKAAASKCCVEWCEYLGCRPSAYMRQTAAKESFRAHNVTRRKVEP